MTTTRRRGETPPYQAVPFLGSTTTPVGIEPLFESVAVGERATAGGRVVDVPHVVTGAGVYRAAVRLIASRDLLQVVPPTFPSRQSATSAPVSIP